MWLQWRSGHFGEVVTLERWSLWRGGHYGDVVTLDGLSLWGIDHFGENVTLEVVTLEEWSLGEGGHLREVVTWGKVVILREVKNFRQMVTLKGGLILMEVVTLWGCSCRGCGHFTARLIILGGVTLRGLQYSRFRRLDTHVSSSNKICFFHSFGKESVLLQ